MFLAEWLSLSPGMRDNWYYWVVILSNASYHGHLPGYLCQAQPDLVEQGSNFEQDDPRTRSIGTRIDDHLRRSIRAQ